MINIFLVAETRDYVTRTCVCCRNVYNLQICCVEWAQPSGHSVLLAPSFYSVKNSEPFYRTTFMQMDKIEKYILLTKRRFCNEHYFFCEIIRLNFGK